jgi:hypothetical protein
MSLNIHYIEKKVPLKIIDSELYMFWPNFVFDKLFLNKKSYEVRFNAHIYIYVIACRAVAMQRPRDWRIYQGRFWATAR